MSRDYEELMRALTVEEAPCRRLPRPDNGDGPTARLMAVERQRRLWAGEFNGNDGSDDLPLASGGNT